MRFKGLDLNLLVALDRLLAERNVSRAAEKLHLSQSATSSALARLRTYFEDDLLVQVGREMALTPRAQELGVAVRNLLVQVDTTIVERPELDLGRVQREIRIMCSGYVSVAYLSPVIRAIQKDAPGLKFFMVQPHENPTPELSRGGADFVIMPKRFLSADHPSQEVMVDDHAVIVWNENEKVGETLDLDTFLGLRQVTIRLPEGPPNYEIALANRLGPLRSPDVVVGSFTTVPFMVVGTQDAAVVHERLARIFCETMPLRMYPCPVPLPQLKISLQWHTLSEGDPLLSFVRRRLLDLDSHLG